MKDERLLRTLTGVNKKAYQINHQNRFIIFVATYFFSTSLILMINKGQVEGVKKKDVMVQK